MSSLVDFVIEHLELLMYAVVIVSSIISAWMIKRRLKRKMEYLTATEVKDDHLVSISEWMKAYNENEKRHIGRKL
ncbi:MAG: hypothetical protein WAV20_00935 [Blastocatellia bacterium]